MLPRIYLAGRIGGLTYDGASRWREDAAQAFLGHGVETVSPMRAKEYLRDVEVLGCSGYGTPMSSAKGIVSRDRNDVRTADCVLAYLPGISEDERPSLGTMIELGWSDAWRIPFVAVTAPGDLYYEHAMVNEMASFITPTLREGIEVCLAVLNRQVEPVIMGEAGFYAQEKGAETYSSPRYHARLR
jgi:nucleoside 2-deoxyribosyltransferase